VLNQVCSRKLSDKNQPAMQCTLLAAWHQLSMILKMKEKEGN
jgi:hypothetical protein